MILILLIKNLKFKINFKINKVMSKKTKKPFWDVEENQGFINITAWDNLQYKVWNQGTPESLQRVADTLANIRNDLNRLLVYIVKNKSKWIDHPIAFGIYHTLNLHTPYCSENTFNDPDALNLIIQQSGKDLFNYQEMTPNNDGILGLNKPKICVNIPVVYKGKKILYELAIKRSIFLTIRPKLPKFPNYFNSYKTILMLAIHELTHTTCNDTRWKTDNHKPPYEEYHTMMKKFAKLAGII